MTITNLQTMNGEFERESQKIIALTSRHRYDVHSSASIGSRKCLYTPQQPETPIIVAFQPKKLFLASELCRDLPVFPILFSIVRFDGPIFCQGSRLKL